MYCEEIEDYDTYIVLFKNTTEVIDNTKDLVKLLLVAYLVGFAIVFAALVIIWFLIKIIVRKESSIKTVCKAIYVIANIIFNLLLCLTSIGIFGEYIENVTEKLESVVVGTKEAYH